MNTQQQVHYRQGDVLVERVESIPDGVQPVAREIGRVVLAHGEVTGHAHAIKNRCATFFESDTGARFLSLDKPCDLEHEEHSTITLPPGTYRVVRQQEYSPQAIRNVAD